MADTWDPPSPEAAALLRDGARFFLQHADELVEQLDESVMATLPEQAARGRRARRGGRRQHPREHPSLGDLHAQRPGRPRSRQPEPRGAGDRPRRDPSRRGPDAAAHLSRQPERGLALHDAAAVLAVVGPADPARHARPRGALDLRVHRRHRGGSSGADRARARGAHERHPRRAARGREPDPRGRSDHQRPGQRPPALRPPPPPHGRDRLDRSRQRGHGRARQRGRGPGEGSRRAAGR